MFDYNLYDQNRTDFRCFIGILKQVTRMFLTEGLAAEFVEFWTNQWERFKKTEESICLKKARKKVGSMTMVQKGDLGKVYVEVSIQITFCQYFVHWREIETVNYFVIYVVVLFSPYHLCFIILLLLLSLLLLRVFAITSFSSQNFLIVAFGQSANNNKTFAMKDKLEMQHIQMTADNCLQKFKS